MDQQDFKGLQELKVLKVLKVMLDQQVVVVLRGPLEHKVPKEVKDLQEAVETQETKVHKVLKEKEVL